MASPWPEAFTAQMTVFEVAKTAYLTEYVRLCRQGGIIKKVFSYYNFDLNFYIDWFEKYTDDGEKLRALVCLANLYNQLLSLLKNSITTVSTINAIRDNMATHDRLREVLSGFQPSSTVLIERLAQLNRNIAIFFEEYNRPHDLAEVAVTMPAAQPVYTPRHFRPKPMHQPPQPGEAKPPVSILKKESIVMYIQQPLRRHQNLH